MKCQSQALETWLFCAYCSAYDILEIAENSVGSFRVRKASIDKIIRSSNNNINKLCHDLAQNTVQSAIFGHS